MSDWNTVETKWNADQEKFLMIMDIEKALEEAFITYDIDNIYTLLRAYRRQTQTKFEEKAQKILQTDIDEISRKYEKYKKDKSENNKKDFYLYAEGFFLGISQALKNAGVYFREGRDASKAILQR